jgi:hypothetical protein
VRDCDSRSDLPSEHAVTAASLTTEHGITVRTIADARRANLAAGQHWFSADAMRFFRSRVHGPIIGDGYFVTSEQFDDDAPRRYTVRRIDARGHVSTVGESQAHATLTAARTAAHDS